MSLEHQHLARKILTSVFVAMYKRQFRIAIACNTMKTKITCKTEPLLYHRLKKTGRGYITLDDFGTFEGMNNPNYDDEL